MPSNNLPLYFQQDIKIRNAEAWLASMDRRRDELLQLFSGVYGKNAARQWFVRWRIFFMACAEPWGYRTGGEWIVSRRLFEQGQV